MADSLIKRLKLLQVIEETEEARTFILEPLDGWEPQYQAGQFITLVFRTPHGEKRRSYSFTSSPELNEPMSITVKKVENGEFSRPLVYSARPGDIFYSSGIAGLFTLPQGTWPELFCFLAAGSGIAPCYALLKTILAKSNSQVVLFYSNSSQAHAIFYKQLQQLLERYPQRLVIRFLFSDHADLYYRRLSKWLLGQLLETYIPPGRQPLYYLCGPFDYMQAAEITLRMRADREHIIKESFSSLPRLVLPEPPDRDLHRVTVHIGKQTHQLDVQYPASILKTALAKGIELPYSCQAGRCSSCIATCTKGRIWMAYNEVLVDREINKGRVLTCQGFPVGGDAEISFNEEQ
jgi:ring-1,2-phenylacetyl-CoA epoxidase subunit PaaE